MEEYLNSLNPYVYEKLSNGLIKVEFRGKMGELIYNKNNRDEIINLECTKPLTIYLDKKENNIFLNIQKNEETEKSNDNDIEDANKIPIKVHFVALNKTMFINIHYLLKKEQFIPVLKKVIKDKQYKDDSINLDEKDVSDIEKLMIELEGINKDNLINIYLKNRDFDKIKPLL